MGNNLTINDKDLENLADSTKYSQDEIKRMYTRFLELSKDSSYVSIEDLKQACELENTDVSRMVLDQFKCGIDQVNFEQLVQALSAFQHN